MMRQKLFRHLALALAILSVSSIAVFAHDSTTLRVSAPISISGTQLKAGKYKLTWEARSSGVLVTFTKGSKVMATAEGRLVDRDHKYNRSAVVYKTNPDGTRTLLEIRLGDRNQAIVFKQ